VDINTVSVYAKKFNHILSSMFVQLCWKFDFISFFFHFRWHNNWNGDSDGGQLDGSWFAAEQQV